MKNVDLIFPDDPFDGYEVKDHIFEISKLVDPSEFNSKFSELFYEARHQTYTDAWKLYEEQLVQDIIEQVFMTLTASAISSALHAIPFAGVVLGPLGYFFAYTLMTKFSMDVKSKIADSQAKAFTFYPLEGDRKQKTSLSERIDSDEMWGDNMPAALMGHPGAYYTTIQGEDDGQIYSAQAIVSPPNPLRDTSDNIGGFLEFLWDNAWKTTESNPDLFTGLDFDGLELDFLLMTNELSALNDVPGYSFTLESNQAKYNDYRSNTLGYLQQKIKEESNGKLDAIKPIIINGKPQYVFIDSSEDLNQATMPLSHLYQPVIVSSDRAKYASREAKIEIDIECAYASNTQGINAYQNLIPEEKELFASKIPLSNIAFAYPIKSVVIELVENTIEGLRIVLSVPLNDGDYNVEFGNLYVKEAIDSIFFPSQSAFNFLSNEGIINPSSNIYYKIKITFDLVVEDSGSSDHSRMALSQATSYAVMDYFNQYTYASVTANMIGEIAYTEILTLISTLITAPVLLIGGWTTEGVKKFIGKIGVKGVAAKILKGVLIAGKIINSILVAPIKEMFEEIITDGFIETWAERQVELWGGTEDMGFWFSALCTSGRETLSGSYKGVRSMMKTKSNQISTINTGLSNSENLHTWVAQNMAKDYKSDSKSRKDVMKHIAKLHNDGETDILLKTDEKTSILKIAYSGITTAFKFTLSNMFLGSQTMSSMLSLSAFSSTITGMSAKLVGRHITNLYNARVNKHLDFKKLQKDIVNKKSDVDQEANANEFAEQTGEPMPSTDTNMKAPRNVKEGRSSEIRKKFGFKQIFLESLGLFASMFSLRRIDSEKIKVAKAKQSSITAFTESSINAYKLDKVQSVKISLESMSASLLSHFEKIGVRQWNLGTNEFIITKVDDSTTINSVISQILRIFDINPNTPLKFWSPVHGVFEIGSKIQLTNEVFLNFDEQTKFKEISSIEGLQLVYDISRLSQLNKYTNYVKIRDKFSYYLGGTSVFNVYCSSVRDAETMDSLFKFINDLAMRMLDKKGIFSEIDGFNHQQFVSRYKTYHDSIYLNKDIESKIKTSSEDGINDERWSAWQKTSEQIYKATCEAILKNTEISKFIGIIIERAEFAILKSIVSSDTILMQKSTKEGGPALYEIMSRIEKFIESDSLKREITSKFSIGKGATQFFFKEFQEAFFDNPNSEILDIQKSEQSYPGRIGEANDYSGDLRYRVLENFIKYGYNSPVIVIDGINFGGKGTHMIGNEYILSQGETIYSVKNKILDIEMKSLMNSLPSARRIYDNNIVLFWNPNTEKGVYVIQPAKNTFSSTGISSNQMSDIGKDGASAQINTAFLEAGRGIREISKISDVQVTFVAPPVNKNPVSTLITIIKRIATRNKFKNFGTSNKHKMISDFSYLFSIVEGINTKLMNELNNAGNKEEAKTIIESFIDNQLNTDQSWLNDLMEDSARSFYSARRFAELIDQNYKTQTILLIRSLLGNKIIKDTSGNGFKIGLEEELNMLFLKKDGSNNPIPLTYEDLPSAFTIKNGEKVMLTKNLYNEFKSENKPLMVVHDSNGEIGIVAAQIFTDLRLKNGEVITEGYKHNGVGEFAGAVFHNVYLCDANFNKLVSRVEIKSGSEQHIVRQSGWEIGFIEVALAGNIMQLYTSEYYMAFGITSGDQHFCFLQKTIAKMNPYDHQEKILPDISFKARYKNKAVKFLEQSEDLSQEDENNLLLVANFLYQIGNRYQKDNDDLAIADLFLQINEKSHKLFDGTIMTYSRDSYRQILTALDPSTQLKDMTLFQIDSEGNVQYDSPDIKTFFKTWLQFIKNDLNKPSEQSSHLFDKFSHLADSVYSFTDDPKLQLIEDVANPGTYLQNDLMVLRLTREALKEAFGSIGYTLLTTGLMTFTQSATGSYEVHFKNHDNRILGQMFNKFNLRGLYSSRYNVYTPTYFTSTNKKMAHVMTVSTFASFLFSGYAQNYEYDLVQDTLKTPSSVWNNILPTDSFFAKLFTNYPKYYQTPGFYEYARNSFYNTYLNNYLVREKARYYGTHDQTLSGRQVLVSEIGSLFEGDSTLDEVLADYLGEDFRYRIYKLSRFRPDYGQVVNRDYISLIRETLKGAPVKLRFGDQNAVNPIFKISGEDPNSGYFLNLDSNTLSSDVLQQIMMTLEYYAANGRKKKQFENEVAQIENVWHKIKEPIKETYDKLYDYLWNFKDEQGNPANQFSVSFRKTTYDGIDPENSLLLNSIPFNEKGSDLTGEKIDILIDRSNPLEFRKAILSCIKYMVKYNSFALVKVGNSDSVFHALYLSLDKFLTNKYIATSFTGNSIQGDLTPFANNLYLTEKEEFDKIWDADKIFPIYAFKDAENFDQWLIEYFASLSASYQTVDNRYSNIKELMDLN